MHRIMVVEDEAIVAMDVQQRLESMGYQVIGRVTTGEGAVQLALQELPDLILMDIKLRGRMDGIEAAAIIRQKRNLPVIFISAFSNDLTLKRASEIEAFGYLIKPFDDRALLAAVEIALYKHKMEEKLRISEERLELVIKATHDAIWDWDLLTDEVHYSQRWQEILGYELSELVVSPYIALDLVHPQDSERFRRAIKDHLDGLTPDFEVEYRMLHKDGGYRWILSRGIALFDEDGKAYRLTGALSDITPRKMVEEQLTHQALHDGLTNLPNRALFLDRLANFIERSKRQSERSGGVMILDIDHFKVINDSLGHLFGDLLLVEFARMVRCSLRPGDTVARLGGDEFAILVEGMTDANELVQIAQRIAYETSHPVVINGQTIYNSASIGIVPLNNEYQSPAEILRDADIAMYHAKNNGRSRFEIFELEMRENSSNRLALQGELHRALEKNEFVLHYQPIYQLNPLKMIGVEALIRWQHPVRGLVMPGEFIGTAEETGLIVPIGDWVLRTACQQTSEWHKNGLSDLRISVNLSACQLNENDFFGTVKNILEESGLPGQFLELELTETTAMRNMHNAILLMTRLRELGIQIVIDDFGSGYASLDYIKQVPADSLKIDRSFIADLTCGDTAIVRTMISLARQLQKDIVAEGVETQEQVSILTQMGCDKVQGFYFSKGIPAEKLKELV